MTDGDGLDDGWTVTDSMTDGPSRTGISLYEIEAVLLPVKCQACPKSQSSRPAVRWGFKDRPAVRWGFEGSSRRAVRLSRLVPPCGGALEWIR